MLETNYSAAFCTQMLEFDRAPVKVFDKRFFVNTFLIDPVLDGGNYSGNVYLVFKGTLPDTLVTYLVDHPAFKTMYCPKDGLMVFAFSHGDYVEGVVRPFLRGAYSQIDRVYVEKYFPNVSTHVRYDTRRVLDKAESVRKWQEGRIGISLPPDAEVWSKPNLSNETFDPTIVISILQA